VKELPGSRRAWLRREFQLVYGEAGECPADCELRGSEDDDARAGVMRAERDADLVSLCVREGHESDRKKTKIAARIVQVGRHSRAKTNWSALCSASW
jgi:hypothetical protein